MITLADSDVEQWAPVVGFEGLYEASTHGRVRGVTRTLDHPQGPFIRRGQVLKERRQPGSMGYCVVVLYSTKRIHRRVHRIILEAFAGPRPDGMVCRHLDGNPMNNRLANLRWGTQAENIADKVRHGTILRGSQLPQTRLTEDQARLVKRLGTSRSVRNVAAIVGCSVYDVRHIRAGRAWAWVGVDQ
jgi:hypothetical protein